jgi:2-methylcitrate dehydratase PrpD
MVAGYQVAGTLSLALNPLPSQPLQRGGFMPAAVAGTFGAAAAAAKLLGLSDRGMVDAIGLAGSESFGLMTYGYDGSDEKALHAGRAAQAGLFMTRLAAAGLRGPQHVLESPGGLFAAHRIPLDEAALVDGFGRMDAVLYITPKHFACSHAVSPFIDAVADWERRNGDIDAGTIEKVVVRLDLDPKRLGHLPDLSHPLDRATAQLDPRVPIAIYLVKGDLFVEQWDAEAQRDPAVLDLG